MSFATRYPQLHFLLSCEEYAKQKLTLDETPFPKKNTQTLYLYGIALGNRFTEFEKWLDENPYHELIFLEEDLGKLAAFYQSGMADKVFSNAQVHLQFLFDTSKREQFLQDCAKQFPTEKVDLFAHKDYAHLASELRLTLQRRSTLEEALFFEDYYYHELFGNLLSNFLRWPKSFYANQLKGRFKDVPALVCGAGPSLESAASTLNSLENGALIFGGGSTISALSRLGVRAHFGMAIDPNPEEYDCLYPSTAFEEPLIYGSRFYPDCFDLQNGPQGYLTTHTGGACEAWLESELSLTREMPEMESDEALSITTACLAYAVYLGCSPIVLVGVDLANSYASGLSLPTKKVPGTGEQMLTREDRWGKKIQTNVKWVMEAAWISAFAKSHPGHEFIDARETGLPIEDIPYKPLSNFSSELDIRSAFHAELSTGSLTHIASPLQKKLKALKTSVVKSLRITGEISSRDPSDPLALVYQLDLQQELSYTYLIAQAEPRIEYMLSRKYRGGNQEKIREKEKWKMINRILMRYKHLFGIKL